MNYNKKKEALNIAYKLFIFELYIQIDILNMNPNTNGNSQKKSPDIATEKTQRTESNNNNTNQDNSDNNITFQNEIKNKDIQEKKSFLLKKIIIIIAVSLAVITAIIITIIIVTKKKNNPKKKFTPDNTNNEINTSLTDENEPLTDYNEAEKLIDSEMVKKNF